MIRVKQKGSFSKTEAFFNRVLNKNYLNILDKYGQLGVALLRQETPVRTGEVLSAWEYRVEDLGRGRTSLSFINNAENEGHNIVILLMYGHGNGNGGYVEGDDFVTPAIRPLLRDLANALWKEVTT